MNTVFDGAVLVTAVASAMAAGSLFPFSGFAMSGLRRLPAADGIAAMQSINVRAVTPAFMSLLFGTALAGIVVTIWAVLDGSQPVGWVAVGAAVYLVGIPLVTIAFNVPLNERLARLEATDPLSAAFWGEYTRRWTRFNHVRVAAGVAAAGLFTIALTK